MNCAGLLNHGGFALRCIQCRHGHVEIAFPQLLPDPHPGIEHGFELAAGAARLVGTDPSSIVEAATELLTDEEAYRKMAAVPNPFGDGYAARRIVEYLLKIT